VASETRTRRTGSLLAVFLVAWGLAPEALARRRSHAPAASAKTVGLGRSCRKSVDCKHRSQRCLHENDANGKLTPVGFCALPCASFEAGTAKVVPGQPAPPAETFQKQLKKKPKARCPPKFECRSKGAGVPIDMCVKE
jgi:hypothetical protein